MMQIFDYLIFVMVFFAAYPVTHTTVTKTWLITNIQNFCNITKYYSLLPSIIASRKYFKNRVVFLTDGGKLKFHPTNSTH